MEVQALFPPPLLAGDLKFETVVLNAGQRDGADIWLARRRRSQRFILPKIADMGWPGRRLISPDRRPKYR